MSRHHCPKRQLMGFGEPLDWRPLDFVDSVPYVFCCALCGVLPAFPKRLTTCCHVFCPSCFESITEQQCVCPVDGSLFAEHSVEALDSIRGGVNELRAHCPNASHGCTFVGMLAEIREHFVRSCDHNEVHCPRCGLAILQRTALYHHSQECDATHKVEPASDAEADSSNEDACHLSSSSRRSRSRGKSASGKSGDKAKRSGARRVPSAENAGREKGPIVAAIRSLLQDNPGSSILSASVGPSGVPSVAPSAETSLISRGGIAARGDRHKAAKPSKSADGALTSLSEAQLLERVDSMVARQRKKTQSDLAPAAAEVTSSAEDCARAPSHMATTSAVAAESRPASSHDVTKKTSSVAPTGFAFCYVTGLVGAESRLVCGEELVLRSDCSQLADCAFRVHARLRRDADGGVLVCFTLCLCGGTWRKVADWALSSRICLVLVHPWDQAQNMRLLLCLNPAAFPPPKESHPGRWDFWSPTNELKLRDLATRGFVSSGAICVALEIQ
ncbi:uncharacterized protein LOC144107863 [Amblyomma americanum]